MVRNLTRFLFAIAVLVSSLNLAGESSSAANTRTPILLELFTSEGCSSCPPADAILEKLDSAQPIASAELIVLSEHVDYWNHDGWKDPFSSSAYTERQNIYKDRFGLKGPYTPEMVVDGSKEFLGSDVRAAQQNIIQAAGTPKMRVALSSVSLDGDTLRGHVETDALADSFNSKEAEVYVAIVLHHAESQVLRGENAGQHLAYTNVVRTLKNVGTVKRGESFAQNINLKIEPGDDVHNLQWIAFVQDRHQGKVFGAAIQAVEAK